MPITPPADRPAACILLLTPMRAELVFRALCVFLASGQCKPSERADLADVLELLSDGDFPHGEGVPHGQC